VIAPSAAVLDRLTPAQVAFMRRRGMLGDVSTLITDAENLASGASSPGGLVGNAVTVTVSSNLLPTYTLQPLAQDGTPAGGAAPSNPILEKLKAIVAPSIQVTTPVGSYTVAPYGAPTPGKYFPFVVGTGIALGIGLIGLIRRVL
jgi:hypothetical protein